jgi:hypothetical protein
MKYVIATAIVLMLAIGVMVIGPRWAQAQTVCGKRAEIIKNLSDKYNEKSTSLGIVNGTNVVELLTSPGGKTWTIIVSEPSGRTCFVSSGSDWTQGQIGAEGSAL